MSFKCHYFLFLQKFITPNFCESMELFEAGETMAARELLTWKCPTHNSDENQTKWDFSNILSENHFVLKNIAIVAGISSELPLVMTLLMCCTYFYFYRVFSLNEFASSQLFFP